MGKLRFLFALWMAKLSIPALRITRHNGTDFPGSLAVKLCPDFLKYIGKPAHIVAVTGTNGKTTVANMLGDVLTAEGKRVLSNRAGSNIVSGIRISGNPRQFNYRDESVGLCVSAQKYNNKNLFLISPDSCICFRKKAGQICVENQEHFVL